MSKHFNLRKKRTKSLNDYYSEQYSNWRDKQSEAGRFFILYKDFETHHLKKMSSGALKLFLYYGFQSKNETGESWHSISKISEYFDVSDRTINSWNKELEERGLISRLENANSNSKYTWLLPFSTNYVPFNATIEDYLRDAKNQEFVNVYGEIDKIYHVFQWRLNKGSDNIKDESKIKSKKPSEYNLPWHALVIVTKKEYTSSDKFSRLTLHVKELKEINGKSSGFFGVGKNTNLYEDIYFFESNMDIEGYDILGIVVHGSKNMKEKSVMCELFEELRHPEVILDAYETLDIEECSNEGDNIDKQD